MLALAKDKEHTEIIALLENPAPSNAAQVRCTAPALSQTLPQTMLCVQMHSWLPAFPDTFTHAHAHVHRHAI